MLGRLIRLAPELVRAAASHLRRDWWRSGNHMPRPSVVHLQWRVETAYGQSDAPTEWADVVDFVDWRRRQRRARV